MTSTNKRYASLSELCEYLGCGRNSALKIGLKAGAKIILAPKFIRYDLQVIDEYMDRLKEGGVNG